MDAGDNRDVHALGQAAPSIIWTERAEHWMAGAAEQMNAAGIKFRMKIEQRADMSAPELALVRRERGKIHEIAGIDFERNARVTLQHPEDALFDDLFFPTEKFAALRRGPVPEIIGPINQVFAEAAKPRGGPGDAFVLRIGRRTVQQREQRHFFSLLVELPGHFQRDVSAKAIAAEMTRPVRLKRADVGDRLRSHLFDARQFLAAIKATRFQAINRLIGAEMAREIDVTPKHPATGAMHEKQWRLGPLRLNFHDRRAGQHGAFLN